MLFESECMIFDLLEEKKKDKNNFSSKDITFISHFLFHITFLICNVRSITMRITISLPHSHVSSSFPPLFFCLC